jgi:16S rRNA (adenine1518-N6/adenine1519-N6)-dimethyltransferase
MHPKERLAQLGIEPKKSLGQNFLFDEHILAQIAAAADLSPADHVLEIGAGIGSLTRHLAATAGRVVAVELDQRLFPILEQEVAAFSNVELLHADILSLEPAVYFSSQSAVGRWQPAIGYGYKVVGNVPYYITGAILRHLLGASLKPSCVVVTVQKEVAKRLTAVPPNMSLLAVSVQVYGTVKVVMTVKAGAFWPQPDVDSAVVRINVDLQHLREKIGFDETFFFRVVRAGFSQKRKQLKNNLRGLGYSELTIEKALAAAGIDGRRRAETLSVEEWHRCSLAFRIDVTPAADPFPGIK